MKIGPPAIFARVPSGAGYDSRMGHALRELNDLGRGIWIEWSQTSDKCKRHPKAACSVAL